MDEETEVLVEVEDELFRHQVGKYVVICVASFIATKLAVGAYEAALAYYRNHQN